MLRGAAGGALWASPAAVALSCVKKAITPVESAPQRGDRSSTASNTDESGGRGGQTAEMVASRRYQGIGRITGDLLPEHDDGKADRRGTHVRRVSCTCAPDHSWSVTVRKLILITAMSLFAAPSFAQQQQQGTASYYKGGQSGHTDTKSGTPVNPNSNEAASPNLPLGSQATVTNQKTGKSEDVRITDRGPTRQDRVIDLSKKSARDLGMEKSGSAPLTVQPKQ